MQLGPARAVWLAALLVLLLASGVLALVYLHWHHAGWPRPKTGEQLHSTGTGIYYTVLWCVYIMAGWGAFSVEALPSLVGTVAGKKACDD